MSSFAMATLTVCMLSACAQPATSQQSAVQPSPTPSASQQPLRYIARLDDTVLTNEAYLANMKMQLAKLSIGVSAVSQFPGYSLLSLTVQDPSITSQEAVARIQSTGKFAYVEPDQLQRKPSTP